jgi:riboflavin transporter FmnP
MCLNETYSKVHIGKPLIILIVCILFCVTWYIMCIKEQSTQQLVKNEINTNALTLVVVLLLTRYMFRPLYWVIIRRTAILVSVLELHQIPIWIYIVFLRVVKCINQVNS